VCGAVFARRSRELGYEVTVVDTAEIPTIGVGEASIPTIYDLLSHVGIEDAELIKHTAATFKYGIQFEGWSRAGEHYMHGFGNMGTPLNGQEFFSAWLASAAYFTNRNLGHFTPAVVAALKDRFTRVAMRPEDAPENLFFPLAELSYALHFDASLLARLLKQKAVDDGAIHLSRHVTDVATGPDGITSLSTKDGKTLEADFFIDCSGITGVLSRKALAGRFDDWSAFLPCDNAIAVQTERATTPRLFTRSVAHEAGWRWEIQLQSRTGNGCVYSSEYMSEDEATALLMREITGTPITEPRKIAFKTGRLMEPWTHNCAAIGLSAGFLEPLESTSIHLICKYALMLEKSLLEGRADAQAREEFNRAWRKETDEVRDFLMAHYIVNQRPEPFWQARREGPRPETLSACLSGLSERGWIELPEEALFGHDSWYQVLIGQGFLLDYKRFAAPQDIAHKILPFLQNVGRAVASETDNIPKTHAEALEALRAS